MMINITEKCSMGCNHCMNDAKPSGQHMDFDTFQKVVEFQKTYGGPFCIITGGEPTEHPMFMDFMDYLHCELMGDFITITTNGVWMQDHYDEVKYFQEHYPNTVFQVSSVKEYYPEQIKLDRHVFCLPNVMICREIEAIYPQGRAKINNLPWESKGSKCFNVRAIANQVTFKDLRMVIGMLAVKQKFCTPHISIDGHIKLGESDLCPNCSHISKTNEEIMNDIINFRCDKCKEINDKLPEEYRKIIGEK